MSRSGTPFLMGENNMSVETMLSADDKATLEWLKKNDPEFSSTTSDSDRCPTWHRFMVGDRGAADWLTLHDDDDDLTLSDLFQMGTPENTGFALEGNTSEVMEFCHWAGCVKELYAPEERRGRGNPRKWCTAHQKAAEARTERLRYHGIKVGEHRNLSYRLKKSSPGDVPSKPDKAVWIGSPAVGGKSVDQYAQSRSVWNSRRRVR